jgi:hypothetical protein
MQHCLYTRTHALTRLKPSQSLTPSFFSLASFGYGTLHTLMPCYYAAQCTTPYPAINAPHLHPPTVTIQSIDAILVFLESQEDLGTLKLGVQCFASAYPLVFRHA